ncbi:serine/threonine protein kinase [Rhizobium deserti]|uniref:Serine/threonine protein kinase n=1 Tax=Rhizobium deserti TaxID=2547961 RepID=A0A4R5UP37_9HYPH|nr:serine/threonine-protein kinase [Rhizobium deserti]TDK39702.1 serine/threonine protein kinase [Rhizobium deserti]
MLVDQVRDALDRGEDHLSGRQRDIIANSFTLEKKIYEGSLTQVYRARHRDLGTWHAIKTLRDDHARDPIARRLLLREAEIGLMLRHPNIVAMQTLLRLGDGRPALVSEWSGKRLGDQLGQAPWSIDDIRTVMEKVLVALEAIHQVGFVHCDLSPSNLLISKHELTEARLGDFGITISIGARHADVDLAFAGQPDFAAPEQQKGLPLDGRCDLYAAGRLLALLLDHADTVGSNHAASLRALARTLSATDPDARPDSAKAALALLGSSRT